MDKFFIIAIIIIILTVVIFVFAFTFSIKNGRKIMKKMQGMNLDDPSESELIKNIKYSMNKSLNPEKYKKHCEYCGAELEDSTSKCHCCGAINKKK